MKEEVLLRARRFCVTSVAEDTPDGIRTREIVRHPGSVAVVPVVDDEHVCLIRNFRVSSGKTLIEIPAGTLEPNEDPIAAAHRELAEETGYCAIQMRPLVACYLSPGVSDERMHIFAAISLTAGKSALEPDEKIENLIVTWEEAMRLIRDGSIEDAKTITGLLSYLVGPSFIRGSALPSGLLV